ncbi:hypothetical protein PR048_011616 [Dryococelus australis]|uniref:Transposase n=1 Tax=Dryococelus australis TaxID=614101 RepID=A0ABQ9HM12_9NEOP|nr:hypothetical protein PR048_011616 [Dryococelus australis]
MTLVYHRLANPTERQNRELKMQLRLCMGENHASCTKHLLAALFTLLTRTKQAMGNTPAQVLQGCDLLLPI